MSNSTKAFFSFLLVLVIASLALNVFLLWQWLSFLQQAQEVGREAQLAISQAVADLGDFEQAAIQFTVPVQNNIPVKMEIPYKKTLEIPVKLNVPIKQQVKAQVPIEINGVKVPIEVVVPIDMNVPIDHKQAVTIDLVIPIDTTVPLDMEVPVDIKISDTELGPYVERLRSMLNSMNEALSNRLP